MYGLGSVEVVFMVYGILCICIKSFEHMCMYVSARKQTHAHAHTNTLVHRLRNVRMSANFRADAAYTIPIFEKTAKLEG